MGRPAGWMKELTGRSVMKSPGKPSHRREVELWFWREIAKGFSTEDAAAAVGVSSAAGVRWFRERGGMATLLRDPDTCRYLCFAEREEIALLRAEGSASGRSRGRSAGRRRRSPGSCGATRRHGAASWSTGRRWRSGRPSWSRAGPRPPSSPPTWFCASTCRNAWPVTSAAPTGPPWRVGGQGVEGPQQAAPPGPPVGDLLEPGADLGPVARRVPR
jgi:hypothetical protein